MDARRDVFRAIADPTRREILQLIAQNPQNLNAIAGEFDITRQAISLHVKILDECGLIAIKQHGRERFCEAKLEKLSEVHAWTEQYKNFWTTKLDALEEYLGKLQAESKSKKKRSWNKKLKSKNAK